MEILEKFILQILTSAAFSVALLACLGWLFRTWLGERIQLSIKNEYDKKLEKFKAEIKDEADVRLTDMKALLNRQSEILRITATSFSEVQKATIARKIEAVDILWHGIITFRKKFPSSAYLTDILTDKELSELHTDPNSRKHSEELDKFNLDDLISASSNEVLLVRPHLGEFVWALYSIYCTILMRSIFLLKSGRNEQNKILWFNDQRIKDLIESAFGNERFLEFEKLNCGRYQWLSNQFDSSLFKAIDTLLTGKSFSDAALRQAQLMEKHIYTSSSELPPR
jgi:hypothetical protein